MLRILQTVFILICLYIVAGSAHAAEPVVQTSTLSTDVVLRYSEYPTLLEDPDPLTLEIYGDGRVRKHNPRYWKTAGEYELYLSARELRKLIMHAAKAGILDLDVSKTKRTQREMKRAKNAARKARREARRNAKNSGAVVSKEQDIEEVFYISDGEAMEMDIHVQRYIDSSGKLKMAYGRKAIRWKRLQIDANELPEHQQIQSLARYERRIKKLIERPDFVRVDNGN